MIKFSGRLSFKQYIKGKPNPWGIKVWCAADPRTGYMLEYDGYVGCIKEPMTNGAGHHVINKMGACFLDKGHHLCFDNFFQFFKTCSWPTGKEDVLLLHHSCEHRRLTSRSARSTDEEDEERWSTLLPRWEPCGNSMARQESCCCALYQRWCWNRLCHPEGPRGDKRCHHSSTHHCLQLRGGGVGGGLFDGSAPCLLPCWSSLCEVVEIPLLVALPVSYDQCLHCFQGNSETRGAAKNHEAHQFLAGCSACLVCRQICETEGTCPVSVYGGCHSITPSFTCCLQVSWQEAKLFSEPEQQAPYTKGIHHSVELWMSSVLCSPVQSPMLCSLSSATGTAALNRYMCELYRCEMWTVQVWTVLNLASVSSAVHLFILFKLETTDIFSFFPPMICEMWTNSNLWT